METGSFGERRPLHRPRVACFREPCLYTIAPPCIWQRGRGNHNSPTLNDPEHTQHPLCMLYFWKKKKVGVLINFVERYAACPQIVAHNIENNTHVYFSVTSFPILLTLVATMQACDPVTGDTNLSGTSHNGKLTGIRVPWFCGNKYSATSSGHIHIPHGAKGSSMLQLKGKHISFFLMEVSFLLLFSK